jgi:hypothetical protein
MESNIASAVSVLRAAWEPATTYSMLWLRLNLCGYFVEHVLQTKCRAWNKAPALARVVDIKHRPVLVFCRARSIASRNGRVDRDAKQCVRHFRFLMPSSSLHVPAR